MLGLAVLLAFGCGKEEKDATPQPEEIIQPVQQAGCQIKKQRLVAYGDTSDIPYYYDSQNRLIRIGDLNGRRALYSYDASGLKVTIKHYYYVSSPKLDTTLSSYVVLEYYPNGLLRSIKTLATLQPVTLAEEIIHIYNAANQLIRRDYYRYPDPSPLWAANYTYLSSSTIKEELFYLKLNMPPNLERTTIFTFDNKKMPFKISDFHKEGWDYGSLLHRDRSGYHFPDYGNIIKIDRTTHLGSDHQVETYSYKYNAQGYPIGWSSIYQANGATFTATSTYEYNCQN